MDQGRRFQEERDAFLWVFSSKADGVGRSWKEPDARENSLADVAGGGRFQSRQIAHRVARHGDAFLWDAAFHKGTFFKFRHGKEGIAGLQQPPLGPTLVGSVAWVKVGREHGGLAKGAGEGPSCVVVR